MRLPHFAIRRPVFTTMIVAALIVFGLVSYRRIGVSLFPDVDFPVVTVTVPFEGADPETVETEVTDLIEEAVNTISGIKSLRSESAEGISQVFIEFELERDIDVASQDVRDKIATIRGDLPGGVEPPVIEKFDPDAAPILSIVIACPTSIRELTRYADDVLKPEIESTAGVGSVRLVGGRDREIRVWLRVDDLHAYGITAKDVIDTLREENVELPGGRIETGSRELIVKTKGKVERVEDFERLVVAYRSQTPVRLRDVAWVEDGLEDFRSLSRLDGERAVSLLVRRQSGTNLLAVATEVKTKLETIRDGLPQGYELFLAQDLSTFVAASLDEAQGELLRGGLLAVLVILLFLRSLRGALVAAITIPTTIVATYSLMLWMGFTLNMMSMLALSISVGMIIDDSIVVLENSFRHLEEGKSRIEAARAGISEIGFAVVATSLAIGAVFIPVAFMKGLVGRFFYEFGFTVAFAVGISTFVALTLSPMLCSRVLSVPTHHGRVFRVLESAFGALERFYERALRFALRHRALVVVAGVLFFVGSLMLTPFIGKEFVPPADEGQFNVQVETPLGSSIERTSRIVSEIERRLRDLPHVHGLYTTVASGVEERVNVGTVLVRLTPKAERDVGQQELMTMARGRLADLTHLKMSVEIVPRVSGGGYRSSPVEYNLRGPDLAELDRLAGEMISRMNLIPGLVDVNSTYDAAKPEVAVNIDRDRAADLGVDIESLGSAVQSLIGGQEVTTFEEGGERFDVRLRLMASGRDRPDSIYSLPVRTRSDKLVELRSLVDVQEQTGPVQIDRQNRSRQITILANLEPSKPLAAALEDVSRIEAEMDLPTTVTGAITGFGDLMEESFSSIYFSLFLAVVLVYMILAAQFESFLHPFTIMLSLPLSVGGALGGLALTGRTLNIFSMIGMIMLMGLVTKNAILLVDYTNQLRASGLEKTAAILRAGPIRLRPILMTACSTIAGMIPIAIGVGEGAESRGPMGVCVVGGLITSTVLTLVVVPVVYSLVDDVGQWVRRTIDRWTSTTPLGENDSLPVGAVTSESVETDRAPTLAPKTVEKEI